MMDRVLEWLAHAPDWFIALWTALAFFVASNIEPMPGVWVAAFFGSSLSTMTGRDRKFTIAAVHFVSGLVVGVFASQIIREVITLHTPLSRVGFAFFAALFAEKLVAGISNGELFKALLSWRAGK
jgi:hypothetical protein